MVHEVVRSATADRDLALIFDFLVAAAREFGEDRTTAFDRAEAQLVAIEDAMARLGMAPHQGTLDAALGEEIRHVTNGRAVFYFDVDEAGSRVRVLAVFYGGQDHRRHMVVRLAGTGTPEEVGEDAAPAP